LLHLGVFGGGKRFRARELARQLALPGGVLTDEIGLLTRVLTFERGALTLQFILLTRELLSLAREFLLCLRVSLGLFPLIRGLLRSALRHDGAGGKDHEPRRFLPEHDESPTSSDLQNPCICASRT
jgi:hypothetical protein